MEGLRRIHIGLVVRDHTLLVHLRASLSLAGYTAISCISDAPSLKACLEMLAEQLGQANASPYDLLIVDLPSAEISTDEDNSAYFVY
ncbi:MAG TPA: hypothetical protein VH593_07840, partial [Ktedonobacteraceae bacterium]